MGDSICHTLHGNRRIPANRDVTDPDLTAFTAVYGAPRSDLVYIFGHYRRELRDYVRNLKSQKFFGAKMQITATADRHFP